MARLLSGSLSLPTWISAPVRRSDARTVVSPSSSASPSRICENGNSLLIDARFPLSSK